MSGPRGDRRATELRMNAKNRSKAAAKKSNATAADLLRSSELAAGLSIFPDPVTAARYVGIDAIGEELDNLVALARGAHQGIIDGDPSELGRRLSASIHLMLIKCMESRGMISPRDLPHVTRALAQVHQIMVGEGKARFSEVKLYLVGADGQPFDPNADVSTTPAPALVSAPASSPAKVSAVN